MSIWHTLELEATSDSREIKRAYARKLKVTRPDEQPEAFQQLHYAYKAALDYAAYQQYQAQQASAATATPEADAAPATELHAAEERLTNHSEANPIEASHIEATHLDSAPTEQPLIEQSHVAPPHTAEETPAVEAEPTETVNPYQVEGEKLIAQAQALLATNSDFHEPAAWEFLMRSPFILDDQFNWRLGLGILQVIQEHNTEHTNRPMALVGRRVLSYLDSIFNWTPNRYHIYRFLDEESCAPLLDQISSYEPLQAERNALEGLRGGKQVKQVHSVVQPQTLYYASQMKRLLALVIDGLGMLLIGALIAGDLSSAKDSDPGAAGSIAVLLAMLLGFFYFWLCECSSTQATLGKLVMGLVATNRNFERMTYWQGFWRSLVFTLSLPLNYITLAINAMMGDKLLHDRITKTYVIDMRRSRETA